MPMDKLICSPLGRQIKKVKSVYLGGVFFMARSKHPIEVKLENPSITNWREIYPKGIM